MLRGGNTKVGSDCPWKYPQVCIHAKRSSALLKKGKIYFATFNTKSVDLGIRNKGAAPSPATANKSQLLSDLRKHQAGQQEPQTLADRLRPGGLAADGFSYKENFIVRCYEVGVNRTATIETMANLLQEVACNHAQSVGFSTDGFATTPTMRKRHLIWVTARMHIEIYKYPVWGDVVEIETWCQGEGKIGTRRDWILKDAATEAVIGRATSKWVMMNRDTRRLSRATDDVRDEYMIYFPQSPRLAFPEENNSSSKKIPKLEDPAHHSRSGLMPRRADLDMNQHVNNVTYIGWVLESMPPEVLDTHELHMITLDYRRECKQDDIVESLTSLELDTSENSAVENCSAAFNGTATSTNGVVTVRSPVKISSPECFEFLHMLRLAGSGFEINRGRTEWRKKLVR